MPRHDPDRALGDVGRRIAELRRRRAWTQEEMADRVGVSLKYLQRIEAGRENLTIRSLVRVATVLDAKPRDLFLSPRARVVRRGRPPKAAQA